MLSSPEIGDRVQVWYGPKSRDVMPHHARCGVIAVVGTGRPRNHGVRFSGGEIIAVPAGNLRRLRAAEHIITVGGTAIEARMEPLGGGPPPVLSERDLARIERAVRKMVAERKEARRG